jgi:hypothetical protein
VNGSLSESKSALVGKRSVAPWMELDHGQQSVSEVNVSAFMERVRQETASSPDDAKQVDYERVNYAQMNSRKAWAGDEVAYEAPEARQKDVYDTTKEIDNLKR